METLFAVRMVLTMLTVRRNREPAVAPFPSKEPCGHTRYLLYSGKCMYSVVQYMRCEVGGGKTV